MDHFLDVMRKTPHDKEANFSVFKALVCIDGVLHAVDYTQNVSAMTQRYGLQTYNVIGWIVLNHDAKQNDF